MERLIFAMTDRLIARGVAAEEERAIIRYGLEVMLETVLAYASILILAWLMGDLMETVVFLGAFMLLRCYAGGYHASTRWRCYLLSLTMVGIFILALAWTPAAWVPALSVGSAGVAVGLVFALAPVAHPNHPITVPECRHYRRRSRQIVLAEAAVVFVGTLVFPGHALVGAMALALAAISLSLAAMYVHLKKQRIEGR